jgi:hypothetical protein
LAGAAETCRTHAQDAGLPGADITGNYLAWLADDTDSPSSLFRRSGLPYRLTDPGASQVAANWDALLDCTGGQCLDHAIDHDEGGDPISDDFLTWTNVTTSGTPALGANCTEWSTTAVPRFGLIGDIRETDPDWTEINGVIACGFGEMRLYCFQQT